LSEAPVYKVLKCGNSITFLEVAVGITMSSRDFSHNISAAKKAALKQAVLITDRGRPTHVLINFQDFENLTHQSSSIGEILGNSAAAEIDFEPDKLTNDQLKPASFT
jgi:PHD/YefM family antitoxin component YafN of YafNO toxin-antitoxin module